MNVITQQSATAGQVKQINRFGSDAIEKVLAELGLDNPGAQRVIEHGDDFAEAIRTAAITSLKDLSVTDKFKNEEVKSSYTYPKEYKGPKPINDQIKAIAKIFGLDPSHALEFAKTLPELPSGAEGWFAIPSVDALAAKHFPEVTDPTQKYCQAVQLVHAKIADSRSFYNYRDGQLGAEYLRQHAKTVKMFQKLGDEQKDSDILVVPAQFGLRHKGRSVRRAREVFAANEFGLGAFAIGIMLLTHPEREVQWEQLHVDCAGDEFSPDADGDFSFAPIFNFSDGKVEFSADWFVSASDRYGSSSAFLPQ